MEDDRGKPSTDGKDFAWRICAHLGHRLLLEDLLTQSEKDPRDPNKDECRRSN